MWKTTVATLSSILRNCVTLSAVAQAKQTHAQIIIHGLLHNVTLQTDLLLIYSKSGFLKDGRRVFDKMHERNMHSWNILIASYVSNSLFFDALNVFNGFLKLGLRPDHYTLPPVFMACSGIGDISLGLMLHGWVIRLGFEEYVVVGSSILDFYLKCLKLIDAKSVFVNMSWKDSVVWNSMISGFARAGFYVDALNCFRDMFKEGVEMDSMTVPGILNACRGEGDLMKGKEVHGRVVRSSLFDGDVAIGNSLIDMYAKCGCLCDSEMVFQNMPELNLVTWTTMISCYGLHGRGEKSLVLFKEMRCRGLVPNSVTLTAILSSCSHSGLIEEGQRIFNSIHLLYGFEPTVEHYACMVDLFGRYGYLEEALGLLRRMKSVPTASVWGALLAGCIIHKNVEIGEIAAHHLLELEPKNSSNYIALCSLYDPLSTRNGLCAVGAKMREMGLVKTPGCSWITILRKVQKFYQGDLSHPLSPIINETLDGMVRTLMFTDDCG